MTFTHLWTPGPALKSICAAMVVATTLEFVLITFIILMPYVITVPDNLFLYLQFQYFHLVTWIMGYAVSNKTTSVGYFMMYIAACVINIIMAVIFFGIVTNNVVVCNSQGYIECDYNETVLATVEFILTGFLFISILQLTFTILIMLMVRKHESDVYMTLKHLTITQPKLMQDPVIKTYMNEPIKLVRARLIVEFLSISDFWISVIVFIISILQLAPTPAIANIFWVFIGHTFIGPMGLAIGTGIESTSYIDYFVILNMLMVIVQTYGLIMLIILLQLECSYCSYILYVIAWIEVAFGILLTLTNGGNTIAGAYVAELVFANIKSMQIDKKVRLGNTKLEDSDNIKDTGFTINKYRNIYRSFWFGR